MLGTGSGSGSGSGMWFSFLAWTEVPGWRGDPDLVSVAGMGMGYPVSSLQHPAMYPVPVNGKP